VIVLVRYYKLNFTGTTGASGFHDNALYKPTYLLTYLGRQVDNVVRRYVTTYARLRLFS